VTQRGRHALAAGALVALFAAACGGVASEHAETHARRSPGASVPSRSSPTSRSTSTSTSTRPAPATGRVAGARVAATGSFDITPPPAVVDRGSDYAAIVHSLDAYGDWLAAHHPDPRLVDRAYAWGSQLWRDVRSQLADEQRLHQHIVEVDRVPPSVTVRSVRTNVVSLAATEFLGTRAVVTDDGRVLQRVGPADEHYLVMLFRTSPSMPWRFELIEPAGAPVEVQK